MLLESSFHAPLPPCGAVCFSGSVEGGFYHGVVITVYISCIIVVCYSDNESKRERKRKAPLHTKGASTIMDTLHRGSV